MQKISSVFCMPLFVDVTFHSFLNFAFFFICYVYVWHWYGAVCCSSFQLLCILKFYTSVKFNIIFHLVMVCDFDVVVMCTMLHNYMSLPLFSIFHELVEFFRVFLLIFGVDFIFLFIFLLNSWYFQLQQCERNLTLKYAPTFIRVFTCFNFLMRKILICNFFQSRWVEILNLLKYD